MEKFTYNDKIVLTVLAIGEDEEHKGILYRDTVAEFNNLYKELDFASTIERLCKTGYATKHSFNNGKNLDERTKEILGKSTYVYAITERGIKKLEEIAQEEYLKRKCNCTLETFDVKNT